jgi:hypothetical protein
MSNFLIIYINSVNPYVCGGGFGGWGKGEASEAAGHGGASTGGGGGARAGKDRAGGA